MDGPTVTKLFSRLPAVGRTLQIHFQMSLALGSKYRLDAVTTRGRAPKLSASRAIPRYSTTRSYHGDASNRLRSIQTVCEDMATPGELFSDESLDQEDYEKELDILIPAHNNNSVHCTIV